MFSGHPLHSPRERRSEPREGKDGLENNGRSGTASAVCGGGQPRREDHVRLVPGVRHLSADRNVWRQRYQQAGSGWNSGEESPAAAQSLAHGRRVGAAGGGDAPQRYPDWGARKLQVLLRAGGRRVDGAAPCTAFCCGTIWCRNGSAPTSVAALRARRTERAMADGFQRVRGDGMRTSDPCRCWTITAAICWCCRERGRTRAELVQGLDEALRRLRSAAKRC